MAVIIINIKDNAWLQSMEARGGRRLLAVSAAAFAAFKFQRWTRTQNPLLKTLWYRPILSTHTVTTCRRIKNLPGIIQSLDSFWWGLISEWDTEFLGSQPTLSGPFLFIVVYCKSYTKYTFRTLYNVHMNTWALSQYVNWMENKKRCICKT